MASEEDHTVYGEEDLDEEEEDEESEEEDLNLPTHPPPEDDEEDDVDVDVDDDSTSSSNLAACDPTSVGKVTIAVAGVPNGGEPAQALAVCALPDPKRQRIEEVSIATVVEEKKPLALDESRRLFQRLWTDEDEIELLQGFLDYTTQRGMNNSSHHHDTTAFYDQIKCKLQLDFNKNQLVEKLRRLKKKYRNVLTKIDSGKEYVFKSPHDQATFEISRKIWSGVGFQIAGAGGASAGGAIVVVEDGGIEEDEGNHHNHNHHNPINHHPFLHDLNGNGLDLNNNSEKKVPRSRKRVRTVKTEEKPAFLQQPHQPMTPVAAVPVSAAASIPNLVEDTVRSCLSPLFKELIQNATNGPASARNFAGVAMNPVPLNFNGGPMNFNCGEIVDEKWRKQHILELEVYSKRLELVQEQIKSQLDELRSMGS
jgi:hypothetical protein